MGNITMDSIPNSLDIHSIQSKFVHGNKMEYSISIIDSYFSIRLEIGSSIRKAQKSIKA
jgi:hypothetical protein